MCALPSTSAFDTSDQGSSLILPARPRGAQQIVVVERHQHTVGGHLHIGLEVAVAEVDGVFERLHRVLGHVAGPTSVSERQWPVPVEIRMTRGTHEASIVG